MRMVFALVLGLVAMHGSATTITLHLDRGADLGQNFGSLFEVQTENGAFTIGAGFSGAYNTRFRHDRHTVHFFVRPETFEREWDIAQTSRPSTLTGTYLFNKEGQVFSANPDLRLWDPQASEWRQAEDSARVGMLVGARELAFEGSRVYLDESVVLEPPPEGSYGGFYYANGYLVFYHIFRPGEPGYRLHEDDTIGYSKLLACPWQPGDGAVDLEGAITKTLPVVGEFPYAYGQLGDQVVSCSNIGGVYALRDGAWHVLVEADLKTSYQVYAAFTYYDKLLLGHYPSGELLAFNGETIEQLHDWPPVMPGVSDAAREAQTIVAYGGELYVGVWPWGEVWRYHPSRESWRFMGRMFTHPEPTNATTHPYEIESQEAGVVLNVWGQRVTSMIPLADALLIATSSKSPLEWDPRFDFISKGKWQEYGRITHVHVGGHLSAPVAWSAGETTLTFTLDAEAMTIEQDGRIIGRTPLPNALESAANAPLKEPGFGTGLYGRYGGEQLSGQVTP